MFPSVRAPSLLCFALLGACATPAPERPAAELPRHAALVESDVLRSVAGEPQVAQDAYRRVAILEAAERLDPLEPETVAGFRLDVSTTLEVDTPQTLRVKALVAVHTVGPPEQMRAMLQGTGTVQRGTDREADLELAATGAVRAAMRRLLEICRRFSRGPEGRRASAVRDPTLHRVAMEPAKR